MGFILKSLGYGIYKNHPFIITVRDDDEFMFMTMVMIMMIVATICWPRIMYQDLVKQGYC